MRMWNAIFRTHVYQINNLTFQNKKIIKSCPVDYVHVNPLKQGFVKRVADWLYFTFQICRAR